MTLPQVKRVGGIQKGVIIMSVHVIRLGKEEIIEDIKNEHSYTCQLVQYVYVGCAYVCLSITHLINITR